MSNPIKLLVLIANPTLASQAPLRLDAEVRLIDEALRRSRHREQFELFTQLATRPIDLRRSLLDYRPQIVHFSGHGTGEEGLLLENDAGQMQEVSNEALTQLFSIFAAGEIECVLLNACYSEVQANAIHQFVDCVIGMNQPINDTAAVNFAEGFYDALGSGGLYDEAFKAGCSAISLSNSPGASIPVLKYRPRPNALSSVREQDQASAVSAKSDLSAQTVQQLPAQSQTFGNVTISGSNNPFNAVQAGQSVTINQSQTRAAVESPNLQILAEAIEELREAIARSSEVDDTEKAMAEIPLQKMKEEVQKSQPSRPALDKMMAMLQKTLDGAAALADPMMKVAALVTQLGVGV